MGLFTSRAERLADAPVSDTDPSVTAVIDRCAALICADAAVETVPWTDLRYEFAFPERGSGLERGSWGQRLHAATADPIGLLSPGAFLPSALWLESREAYWVVRRYRDAIRRPLALTVAITRTGPQGRHGLTVTSALTDPTTGCRLGADATKD